MTPGDASSTVVGMNNRTIDPAVRWATIAGAAWVAIGLESGIRNDSQDYRTVLWVLPFLATTIAVALLHQLHDGRGGWVERAGWAVHMFGAPVIVACDLLLLDHDRRVPAVVAA